MRPTRFEGWKAGLVYALTLLITVTPATAEIGGVVQTPATPMELPIEVEIELSPAGSLKQAPLWKELYQLLKNPYQPVQRRPGFGATMPPLNVYPLDYNFLTAQPLRLRTSDGEVSWDQPGPLFDTAENVPVDAFNTPTVLRTPIGHLVACPNTPAYQAVNIGNFCNGKPAGSLVVYNPAGHSAIPPNGTVVAVAAVVNGVLHELDPATGELEEVVGVADGGDGLEAPVNEEDFFRPATDTAGVPAPLRPYIGRLGAEILGKALFWDMQVGSDGVQACGSCHFNAGADNRAKNQRNPNVFGPQGNAATLEPLFASATTVFNSEVVAADFPFHKLANPDVVTDSVLPGGNLLSDSNDVMSSMGVSRFKQFVDIPPIGAGGFLAPVNGIRALSPDIGTVVPDPVPANEGFRRVEPRNTPTFHGAAFNLDNFWDGRARFVFNGGSVFGASDPTAHIFIDPGNPGPMGGTISGATMGHLRPDLLDPAEEEFDPEMAEQPVRIKFSSLASQSVGPPLSDFEMSFSGRNWAKIGKKMLQGDGAGFVMPLPGIEVTPLANQLVSPTDSRLGPFSNNQPPGSSPLCTVLRAPTQVGRPGLCISYGDLVRLAFAREYWHNNGSHLNGAACADPFDSYCLTVANGGAAAADRNQFTQMEANFSTFFALSVQAYESLTIPDHTPADRFFDANPNAGHGVGEPGDQAVLFPTLIPDLIADGVLDGNSAYINLIPDDPATPEYDGFGADEVFGFDLFAGSNLTAALAPGQSVGSSGRNRNPVHSVTNADGDEIQIRVGSNPFTRSAKCMLCHLGPEQTDHSINISHGLLKNEAEFEYPSPPFTADPLNLLGDNLLPAPEPSGSSRAVGGLILAEEVGEGPPQDAVEVEPRNFAVFDDPATPWDDRVISQPGNFAFGDQGIYNVGVRPNNEDIGRGGIDPFGWPLSLSALTLMNIAGNNGAPCVPGGPCFEPNDNPSENNLMTNFDPEDLELTFEETGDGAFFPGTQYDLQSINPGFERRTMNPLLPEYLAPWVNDLPAGELHPQIDEMAGMVPNTLTPPNGGPGIEFPEVMFGADLHCANYNPAIFGFGPPNWGWGAPAQTSGPSLCPQHQSGVAGNFAFPVHGTWPVPNRVLRDGAFKAPPLRNVELTGPYFHTGSFLTLRQVVDFYFRGGDFPITNAESRDPHVVDLFNHAFSFGRTTGDDIRQQINFTSNNSPDTPYLVSDVGFADGLPDTVFLYDEYPDSNHPVTPEPAFASRADAIEDAKNSLVKFLLALTDPRVKYERAPFDRPQIIVPVDGTAPENTAGATVLAADARFRNVAAVGATGVATAVPAFLSVTNIPPGAAGFNCSSSAGPVSHFCSVVNP